MNQQSEAAMINVRIFLIILVCFLFVGCASTMKSVTLKRAAFDLDCSEDQLQIQELTTRTWGVKGCGKRATYITQGECSTESSCLPVMNSEKSQDQK